ncbi:HEAT repeat domain-containing protein [Halobacterium sp. KA-4]|uniref:HEAT repeat domain-containing protein n=1 Tax=Halobacterium sp. KA-4 TaxID=2896367 RepID=UPI001E3677C1|nr:HEAT repeat domain-containing protein [Halobacterium sp. KA-4]MCD2199313.1 HEAT repeat domain-containing protein [Halobacterium sp. KA-4]
MSDGDEEPEESADAPAPDVDVETLQERLDDAVDALESAETEADLDDVEAILDAVESDLEAADLPEPEEEDEEAPAEALESRLSELRENLEAQRGPYAEDVVTAIEDAQSTLESTRWTKQGEQALQAAVSTYLDDAGEALDETFVGGEVAEPEALAEELDEVVNAVEAADLDPDEDAATIEALTEATDALTTGVEDAQEWDDLSVRQKLRAEGYYEVMGQKRKDFPPEWTALKQWEQRENVEMILLCLEHMGDSDFMERHCLEALKRVASTEALDEVGQRAARRNTLAVEIVGRIGSEDGIEHVIDFVDAEGNPDLRMTALKSLGEIGSEDTTQDVANQLVADNDSVRSRAARSLGLIGDTRAIEPLTDVLADDDSDTVRASAAWALVQIGTERALEAAAEYADDRAYIVEQEAQKAADELDADTAEAAA